VFPASNILVIVYIGPNITITYLMMMIIIIIRRAQKHSASDILYCLILSVKRVVFNIGLYCFACMVLFGLTISRSLLINFGSVITDV